MLALATFALVMQSDSDVSFAETISLATCGTLITYHFFTASNGVFLARRSARFAGAGVCVG
jgi:hypothetical protein